MHWSIHSNQKYVRQIWRMNDCSPNFGAPKWMQGILMWAASAELPKLFAKTTFLLFCHKCVPLILLAIYSNQCQINLNVGQFDQPTVIVVARLYRHVVPDRRCRNWWLYFSTYDLLAVFHGWIHSYYTCSYTLLVRMHYVLITCLSFHVYLILVFILIFYLSAQLIKKCNACNWMM